MERVMPYAAKFTLTAWTTLGIRRTGEHTVTSSTMAATRQFGRSWDMALNFGAIPKQKRKEPAGSP